MRNLFGAALAVLALAMPAVALDDPELLADINLEVSGLGVQRLTSSGGRLFFTVGGVEGEELWSSDGTEAGTALAKDINPFGSSQPNELVDVNGTLFFVATDGLTGRELWKSDGTLAGTEMV